MTLVVFGRERPRLSDLESRGELIGYRCGIIAILSLPGIERVEEAGVQGSLPSS